MPPRPPLPLLPWWELPLLPWWELPLLPWWEQDLMPPRPPFPLFFPLLPRLPLRGRPLHHKTPLRLGRRRGGGGKGGCVGWRSVRGGVKGG